MLFSSTFCIKAKRWKKIHKIMRTYKGHWISAKSPLKTSNWDNTKASCSFSITPPEPTTLNFKHKTSNLKSFSYFVVMRPVVLIIALSAVGCSLQKNSFINEIKDDNSYAYSLPYQKGHAHILAQGYLSTLSHKGEYALDFKMKKGTKVCAAREGIVVATREDSKKGGYNWKYINEGNYIIIKHEDGTFANYWHLNYDGALVNTGDTVQAGQVIGLSGNTGYSAFPHLHFEVTSQNTVGINQIPTRFKTRKGIRYLKPLHRYKAM